MIVNSGYRGKVGASVPKFTYTGTYNVRDDGVVELLTSGTLVFLNPSVIDVFCVGGGSGGFGGRIGTNLGYGGGAGGYTTTQKKQRVSGSINVVIGDGGRGGTGSQSTPGGAGGTTYFGTICEAAGGKAPTTNTYGADGGSGGGAGKAAQSAGGNGGYDGGNGENTGSGVTLYRGGSGQGSTTREFGEETGKLYAGGGGGGTYIVAQTPVTSAGGSGGGGTGGWSGASNGLRFQAPAAGVANTGGGGGGGATGYEQYSGYAGAAGGSGICCFRAAK